VPELPEVETVRRGLEASVVGRTITGVTVTGKRSVRRQSPALLRARLRGRRVERAHRKGKYLALGLDDGSTLVVHLGMSGQLLHVADRSVALAPHTHVVIRLDDGSELRFVDPRTFGEMFVTPAAGDDGLPPELGALGVDPLADGLTSRRLASLLAGRRTPLKSALMNQELIAGIGNIYADEILFRARLRPDRPAGSLDEPETRRLASAIRRTLAEAVEARGSTLRDARYRDLAGEAGSFQLRHAVYGREGERCRRCPGTVTRRRIGGRSAFFCEGCQF
jgi:formamidopyrimidine-DNA glycosylase